MLPASERKEAQISPGICVGQLGNWLSCRDCEIACCACGINTDVDDSIGFTSCRFKDNTRQGGSNVRNTSTGHSSIH